MIALYKETSDQRYLESAEKSANWIISNQEQNGSWIKYSFNNIPHSYYSRVSLALLRLWQITNNNDYKNCALKNLNWVLEQQQANGYFNHASFYNDSNPPLHTIAYTIEGILESGLILNDQKLINSALLALTKICEINKIEQPIRSYRLNGWQKQNNQICLTGLAQISILLFKAYKHTNNDLFLNNAKNIIRTLEKYQITSNHKQINGAIAGSYPLWGKYMPMAYPNWAVKFFIDALNEYKSIYLNQCHLAVFPNDPIEAYLNKGETRINYWNPENFFKKISVINLTNKIFNQQELEQSQGMAGSALLEILPKSDAKNFFLNNCPDIIRTYGIYQHGLLAKNLAKQYNIPLIISLHTNYDDYRKTVVLKAKQYFKYLKQIVWKYLFEINILKSAQQIISVYRFADLYPENLGISKEKRTIIYNRVSPKIFFKDDSIKKNEKFSVINVNSFIPAKNQEVLIKALQYADFNLILVGQGPEKQRLIDLAKTLKVDNKVEFIDSVPNQKLPKLYNECHAYATVINIGGIGIGAIESMACGLPIITSKLDSEPEPELLGFNNCAYVKNDAKDVAEKINKLINDRNYYQELSQKSLGIFSRINGEKGSQAEKNIYLFNI
jgi:glycosyltransferase involved in cell wall biosynthesis